MEGYDISPPQNRTERNADPVVLSPLVTTDDDSGGDMTSFHDLGSNVLFRVFQVSLRRSLFHSADFAEYISA